MHGSYTKRSLFLGLMALLPCLPALSQPAFSIRGANVFSHAIVENTQGHLILCGDFTGSAVFGSTNETSFSSTRSDAFLASFNADGTERWVVILGRNGGDLANDCDVDPAGNVWVTGNTAESVDFDPGPGTAQSTGPYLASYDVNGTFRFLFSPGSQFTAASGGLAVDGSGNVYFSGELYDDVDFDTGPGDQTLMADNSGAYLASFTSAGAYRFAIPIPDASGFAIPEDVAVDASGNVALMGGFSSDFDFDPDPGSTEMLNITGPGIYAASYTTAGAFRYVTGYAFNGILTAEYGGTFDSDGNFYLASLFEGTTDFDPGPGVLTRTSAGGDDGIVLKYNSTGDIVGVAQFGGTGDDAATDAGAFADRAIYVAGVFEGTATFGTGVNSQTLTAVGNDDAVAVAYTTNLELDTVSRIGSSAADIGLGASASPTGLGLFTGRLASSSNDFAVAAKTARVIFAGGFAVGVRANAALPVELTAFTALADGHDALALSWGTATETDNAGFSVELMRPGTRTFQEVDFVPGAGTTSEPRT
ncbi:MAG: hypothetical protein AAGI08_13670, partial [Bacteroidota bacterium]